MGEGSLNEAVEPEAAAPISESTGRFDILKAVLKRFS
jgi:hypothetical protein